MKNKKIVITGGLGYIGSELCKIYSGESRFKNITVIDKRFVSERVKQLRDWGINYVNASILDKDAIKKHLSDADVVIHLAGITDVAYTKTQSNEEQDKEIRETGIEGTRNVLNSISKTCKLIFPSTHVVYEGFSETKENITEETPTCPVLTYACGKSQSEKDIENSCNNYTILRLGSVYGYSTDTMRMGIMPNLFSKIASQNGTIKLFSGGVQLKSLVSVFDVARCMHFFASNHIYQKETYHLAKENVTVKDVALLCKKINPKLTIEETQDEIPNLGYTISNKKLLQIGFEFRYDLESCLREMITNWSEKEIDPRLEYIDKGGKEFIDNRGIIRNYELTEPINLIGYIESKAGTVRANHYHPIQEQKCLLVKGQYISVIQDLSISNAPIETRLINPGDIAIIKPNVAHTMVFTEDSIFLNLVRGEREHENYGITHTIPYKLVDEELRQKLLNTYLTSCLGCKSKNLQEVVSLGMSPLANNLLNNPDENFEKYPLEMNYCKDCHNCQLSVSVPSQKMFDNYLYVSSTASTFRKHFQDAADKYISEFNLNSDSFVVDIGSNDGVFLKPLQNKGIRVLGVEPAKNIAKLANEAHIKTINEYFDQTIANYIHEEHGNCDIVTASNVFAHTKYLDDIVKGVKTILKKNGTFIIEVQYLLDTINDLTFDNIYHEHVNYWSVTSLQNFFNRHNLYVNKVEHIDTHGGSIRVYINFDKNEHSSVQEFLTNEENFGLKKYETYVEFGNKIKQVREVVRKNFDKLKNYKELVLAGYGSPAKATTALNYFGINSKLLPITIEDNTLKLEKIIPGVNIRIVSKDYFNYLLPDVVVVLAWNFLDLIKKNNKEWIDKGVKFISIKDLQDPNFTI